MLDRVSPCVTCPLPTAARGGLMSLTGSWPARRFGARYRFPYSHSLRARHMLSLLLAAICCLPWLVVGSSPSRAAGGSRDLAARVDHLLAHMTLQQKIGQMVMAPVDSVAATGRLGGVVVFGSDITSPSQGRTLIASLQGEEPIPMLVAADEEGGDISTMA